MCPKCGNDTFKREKNLFGGSDFIVCTKCDKTIEKDEMTQNMKIVE
jgi:predicted RNA-binding Zn-ribbon protein involved in translation (DUF1610 family)